MIFTEKGKKEVFKLFNTSFLFDVFNGLNLNIFFKNIYFYYILLILIWHINCIINL